MLFKLSKKIRSLIAVGFIFSAGILEKVNAIKNARELADFSNKYFFLNQFRELKFYFDYVIFFAVMFCGRRVGIFSGEIIFVAQDGRLMQVEVTQRRRLVDWSEKISTWSDELQQTLKNKSHKNFRRLLTGDWSSKSKKVASRKWNELFKADSRAWTAKEFKRVLSWQKFTITSTNLSAIRRFSECKILSARIICPRRFPTLL